MCVPSLDNVQLCLGYAQNHAVFECLPTRFLELSLRTKRRGENIRRIESSSEHRASSDAVISCKLCTRDVRMRMACMLNFKAYEGADDCIFTRGEVCIQPVHGYVRGLHLPADILCSWEWNHAQFVGWMHLYRVCGSWGVPCGPSVRRRVLYGWVSLPARWQIFLVHFVVSMGAFAHSQTNVTV